LVDILDEGGCLINRADTEDEAISRYAVAGAALGLVPPALRLIEV
jgi:hypothetical protein